MTINKEIMPAVNIHQQRLMAQAYAVKIGSLKPSDIDPKYRKSIVDLSKEMTKQQLKDFASTKFRDDVDEAIVTPKASYAPDFKPGYYLSTTNSPILPSLDTEKIKKKLGKKNLENLKDYRDWVNTNYKK
jgi:hypothetical protein